MTSYLPFHNNQSSVSIVPVFVFIISFVSSIFGGISSRDFFVFISVTWRCETVSDARLDQEQVRVADKRGHGEVDAAHDGVDGAGEAVDGAVVDEGDDGRGRQGHDALHAGDHGEDLALVGRGSHLGEHGADDDGAHDGEHTNGAGWRMKIVLMLYLEDILMCRILT